MQNCSLSKLVQTFKSIDCNCYEVLAILQSQEPVVYLWYVSTRRMETIDTNSKDASYLCWSKSGPYLAIGTGKGNLIMYNKKTMKKQMVMGKHSKRIISGCWSAQNS